MLFQAFFNKIIYTFWLLKTQKIFIEKFSIFNPVPFTENCQKQTLTKFKLLVKLLSKSKCKEASK